jgi:hypothetical protein
VTLLKLDYEGTVFLRLLNNNNNGNDNIETARLTQRQRDIIKSKDIKPAITAAEEESTTENAAIDRNSDTTKEDQADVY